MIVIQGGKIVTISHGIIEEGSILIKDGKIKAIGKNIDMPKEAKIIDASNCWITPGLIDCHTHLSLLGEPKTMPSLASDTNEATGPISPEIRAIDALNPFDSAIEKVREAGFTTAYTGPGSVNLIAGTGISFKLRSNTADKMIIPGSEQMKMALGENPKRIYGSDKKMPMTRMGSAALIRKTLYEALNYSNQLKLGEKDPSKAPIPNFKLDSLVKVVRGEQKVRIHCHRSDDIMTAIRIAEEYDLDFSIEHATEGFKIKDVLAEKNIECVIGPLLLEPNKQETWNLNLETPGILDKAGVKICLTGDTASKTAWLPAEIGLLLRRGLSEESAFKSVTINAAELLGIDDKVGTLDIGKDADIAIFDGYPFSNMTLCRLTMIDGIVYHNTLIKK